MISELTEAQKAQYVKDGGLRCPFCGGDNVGGDSVDVQAGRAAQEVGCDDCGAEWCDVYTLTGITDHAPMI